MQEPVAVEPGHRAAPPPPQQFAGVDLRRPKGCAAPAPALVQEAAAPAAVKVAAEGGGGGEGDPCPRCASRDTKFCHYNNYNTSQPRHFCKGCRRYWTKGGTLRNVPVGGGTRKKPSSSSPPSSYAAAAGDVDNKPAKKPASKKRRVVAPAPEPAAVADAAPSAATDDPVAAADDSAKTTTTTTTTDGASEITTETAAAAGPVAMPATEEDSDSLAHLLLQPGAEDAVALGLGLADFPCAAGKEEDSFVWPPAYDLGTCWASAGFVDPDPTGLFLNLP